MRRGYAPVVDISHEAHLAGGGDPWSLWFEQPCGISVEDARRSARVMFDTKISSWESPTIGSCSFLTGADKNFSEYCDTAREMLRFNDATKTYLESEREALFNGVNGKVLAVLSRGTDYKKLQPSRHYIQPEPEELARRAREVMDQHDVDLIFLKAEERRAVDIFEREFGARLRCYRDAEFFDDYEPDDEQARIHEKFLGAYMDRTAKKPARVRTLEYIRAIWTASRCDLLLGGINNGTAAAVVMNGGAFEKVYPVDIGRYK